jgi:hypothetical protein
MLIKIWYNTIQYNILFQLGSLKGRVVQEFQGIGFVMNIVTVDSATCIDISIVSFLNK